MAHEELTALAPVLAAIPAESVIIPTIPISTFLGECEQLKDASAVDAAALCRAGLAEEQLTAFPNAIIGTRSAEVLWQLARFGTTGVPQRWKIQSADAWKLRKEIIRDYRHFFRKNPELLRLVDVIDTGTTNDDMLLNLIQLAELGENNRALLDNTDFDISWLAEARALAAELTEVYAEKGVEDHTDSPTYDTRNRAFTYCKAIVDDIRENGKHIHPKGDPRADLYVSVYHRKKNQITQKNKKAASENGLD